MITKIGLLRLFNVVKTIVVCVITAMGPGVPKIPQVPPHSLSAPLEPEDHKDNKLEAAKGFLRLRYEQMPEQADIIKEELNNGILVENCYVIKEKGDSCVSKSTSTTMKTQL